jgi:hypothetical protein
MTVVAEGLFYYLLISGISLTAGAGILRLSGFSFSNRISLFLSPMVTLCFWTLFLGIGIVSGFPVKDLWIPGWILTAGFGAWGVRKGLLSQISKEWNLFGISLLLPIAVMLPYFWHGLKIYLGSNLPDGWSYVAYGQYLWEYSRGTEGGLAPLYQYAAHLSKARFIASALLAFFSPILGEPGDTQTASGILQAWALFTYSMTCVFFALGRDCRGGQVFLFIFLTIFSGWTIRLLWANNFDNALALSFLPALGGIIHLIDPKARRFCLPLAGVISALFYVYPEISPFILGGGLFFLLPRFFLGNEKRDWVILLFITVTLILLFVSPFLEDFLHFLQSQLAISVQNKGIRPGEGYFPELLIPGHQLYSWWGFSQVSTGGLILHFSLGLALSISCALGIWTLIQKKDWGLLLNIFLLLLGGCIMTFRAHYSYGAYKIFLLIFWAMAFAVVIGWKRFIGWWPGHKFFPGMGIFLVLFLVFGVNAVKIDPWKNGKRENIVLRFKEIRKIKEIVRDQPIYIGVEGDLANQWAVYFLRDHMIHLSPYRAYMAQSHVIPFMERSHTVDPSEIRLVLTDEKKNDILRSGVPYRHLWIGKTYRLYQIDGKTHDPVLCGWWLGFGNYDFVQLSEALSPDGQPDGVFEVEVRMSGEIIAIELRNLDGGQCIWDTIPGNGHVLLGVAEAGNPSSLLNRPDGSIRISVRKSMRFFLYAADNSSMKDGKTKYQVTIFFSDGRESTAIIQGRG